MALGTWNASLGGASGPLTARFLLITMLFIISLSLLVGVVKVRAWLGRAGELGPGRWVWNPRCPPALS